MTGTHAREMVAELEREVNLRALEATPTRLNPSLTFGAAVQIFSGATSKWPDGELPPYRTSYAMTIRNIERLLAEVRRRKGRS